MVPVMVCEQRPAQGLSAGEVEAWSILARESLEPNVYLAPEFILPALEIAPDAGDVKALLVWRKGEGPGRELAAAGVFWSRAPTFQCPVPHLEAFRGIHSYRTGLLVSRRDSREALGALLDHATAGSAGIGAVRFSRLRWDGPLSDLLRAYVEERGATWLENERLERATVELGGEGAGAWRDHISRSRAKDIRRCRNRLERMGEVSWRVHTGVETGRALMTRFLEMEHTGWKVQERTSLRSRPSHERFFLEMTTSFLERGEAFFTELCLDGRAIAITSNLRIGDAGFAFKVAYDPEYSKASPGILNEVAFLEEHGGGLGIGLMDSGAEPGSFIEELWPGRIPLVSGCLARTAGSRALLGLAHRARMLRREVRKNLAGEDDGY